MTMEKWEIPIPEGARVGERRIPKGVYKVRVSGMPEIGTSGRGTRQLIIPLTITEGEFEGRDLMLYRPLSSPRAWGRLRRALEALEVKYEEDRNSRVLRLDPMDFVGKEAKAVVRESSFEGRIRSRVEDLLPLEAEEAVYEEEEEEE